MLVLSFMITMMPLILSGMMSALLTMVSYPRVIRDYVIVPSFDAIATGLSLSLYGSALTLGLSIHAAKLCWAPLSYATLYVCTAISL